MKFSSEISTKSQGTIIVVTELKHSNREIKIKPLSIIC